jgi:hypothetical protein
MTEEGTWVSFDSSSPGNPAQAHVTVSDTSGITVVVDFHGFWRSNYTIDNSTYDNLEMPGASSIQETGKPMLPRLTEYVEIPHDIDVALEVLYTESGNSDGYNISPALAPISPIGKDESNVTELPTPLPVVFDDVYSNNAFFPGYNNSMEGDKNATSIIMRGRRLLELSFYPIQFNPVTNQLKVCSQIITKVKYSHPAQIEPVETSLHSDAFEIIFEKMILNYCPFSILYNQSTGIGWNYPGSSSPTGEGAEYLIITTDAFKNEARRLADWKRRKGILTEIEIVYYGNNTYLPKWIITNAYFNWDPKPTYVLLFGDCDSVPTNYDNIHWGRDEYGDQYDDDNGYIGSDLGYFTVDGYDYFPDMIYGRISVDTQLQAERVVDKILAYEKSPPEVPAFYNRILSAAFFEDNRDVWSFNEDHGWEYESDGVEESNEPYAYYAEEIRHFLKSLGYDIHVSYSAKTHDRLMPDPISFFNGDSVAESLSDIENFEWFSGWADELQPSADNLITNINDGRFLMYHLDHGGSENMYFVYDDRDTREGWYFPAFNVVNPDGSIPDIRNGELTPLIISMACSTAWFDGETDQEAMDNDKIPSNPNPFADYETESFAEYITRMEGGAIAYIGASRVSYTIAGIELVNGIIQSFWPEYSNPNAPSQPIYEMGAALLSGKLNVAKAYRYQYQDTDEQIARTTFEIFHLIGDPELQLWTDLPSRFTVTHPVSISTADPESFVVTVRDQYSEEPVHFAKVCIQQDPGVYQIGYTNPLGQVIFRISPSGSTNINVTVTKHNYIPYTGAMNVFASHAEVVLSDYYGTDEDNIDIELFGFEESRDIKIYFDNILVETVPAETESINIELPDEIVGYVNIWVAQVYDIIPLPPYEWNPVVNTLFRYMSDTHGPDPYIYSQWDPNTWDVTGGVRIFNNPDIYVLLGDYPITNIDEVVPYTEYRVAVFVHNNEDVKAEKTNVTLSSAPSGGGLSWDYIGKDTIEVPEMGTRIAYINWRPLERIATCLRVDITCENDMNLLNNEGLESLNVVTLYSPGQEDFLIGNPTEVGDYVFVKARQQGNYDDVWNVTIADYSSQSMNSGDNELITLHIDPCSDLEIGEWRLFTVELYVNCELVGGVEFKATKARPPPKGPSPIDGGLMLSIGVFIGAGIIITIVLMRKRSS